MDGRMSVRHTANAGVLITTKAGAVGVDLFSRDPQGLYEDTPADLQEDLLEELGKGRIGVLLFTHGHGDHFYMEAAEEALRRNPDLLVISTEEVIGKLKAAVPKAGGLSAVASGERENRRFVLPQGSLEAFNSRHMGEQYAKVQNLVFLLETGGSRIVLPGDAAPSEELFRRIGLWCREPDLMAAPFPLFGIPTNRKMIERSLRVREILAVHLPRPEADGQNWTASAKRVCGQAHDSLPMPVFGEEPGREYVFQKKP